MPLNPLSLETSTLQFCFRKGLSAMEVSHVPALRVEWKALEIMLGEYGVEGEEVTVMARDGWKVGESILDTFNKENWKKGISFKQEKELGEQRWYLEAKNRQVRFDLKIKYLRSLGGLVLFEESFHHCKFESISWREDKKEVKRSGSKTMATHCKWNQRIS